MPKITPLKKGDTITMTRSDFFREHKHLIGLLNQGRKLVKEAQSQTREMKRYI